jgi:hypothetical protein
MSDTEPTPAPAAPAASAEEKKSPGAQLEIDVTKYKVIFFPIFLICKISDISRHLLF